MNNNHTQDWNNYWQGRSAKETGNALLGVGIENNDVLTGFWQGVFENVSKEKRLVDFACGAGSVLRHAQAANLTDLTGIDISEKAIEVLKAKLPDVAGHICPVDETPFKNESFDYVVSQFGFEYAGNDKKILAAVKEMSRILRPGGEIVLVAHIEDGTIQQGCLQSLEQIDLILKSGFFDKTKVTFSSIYKAQEQPEKQYKDNVMKNLADLNVAVEPIMGWLKSAGDQRNDFVRFIHYLIESTQKLLNRTQNYTANDCLSWLDAMESEILAYNGRMSSMVNAAISKATALSVLDLLAAEGWETQHTDTLHFIKDDLPAAWVIRAHR